MEPPRSAPPHVKVSGLPQDLTDPQVAQLLSRPARGGFGPIQLEPRLDIMFVAAAVLACRLLQRQQMEAKYSDARRDRRAARRAAG